MSAPVKSKSRSRSQKRKQDLTKAPQISKPVSKSGNQSMINPRTHASVKPPRQPGNLLNKSTVHNTKPTTSGMIAPFDMGFSFENKENQSINLDEFSPSRINDPAARSGEPENRRNQKTSGAMSNLLDSDSSLSSPPKLPNAHIPDGIASSSGP